MMNEIRVIPKNTPVFILGYSKKKYGVVIGYNGVKYIVEFDDGDIVTRTREYLAPLPRKISKERKE